METQPFCLATLNLLYENAQVVQRIVNRKVVEDKDLTTSTNYVKKYFYPMKTGGSMVWDRFYIKDVEHWQFFFYPKDTLNEVYLNKFPDKVKEWYNKKYHVLYELVNDLKLPPISGSKINMCKSFLHKAKPYAEFSQETKDCVNMMLNHIKRIIADNNLSAYNYVINWLAKMCQGGKNSTILYLKSIGGTGKSTFTDFIFEWVLGSDISLKAPVEILTTPYNKAICGKLLSIFEELPTFSENQWHAVSGKLKDLATGTQMCYTEKYEKSFQAENITSFIINTNVEALKHDRRIAWLDISLDKCKDYEYFSLLRKSCYTKEVGEAFFSYLCGIDISNFQEERDMPETRAKRNAVSSRLESPYQYLKENFILKRKGIKCSRSELYKDYCDWCDSAHKKALGRNEFYEKLREIKLNTMKINGNEKFNIPIETLNAIADKGKWISEYDEYTDKHTEDPIEDNIDDENILLIHNPKYEKILKQIKSIFPKLKL